MQLEQLLKILNLLQDWLKLGQQQHRRQLLVRLSLMRMLQIQVFIFQLKLLFLF
jgi:hypothetical protein